MDEERDLKILQDLIRLQTVNGNEAQAAHYLQEILRQAGARVEMVEFAPERSGLVAEIGPTTGPVLALAGHLDTVAIGDPASWHHDPFGAEVVNGRIYGRGSVDMKGGLAAMVATMLALAEEADQLKGRLRLLISVDEEVGGQGSLQLTRLGYVHDVDAMIVCEATDDQIQYAHCGSFDYQIDSQGKLAHSSRPQLGANAVMNLVDYINQEVHAFDDHPTSPVLGELVHSVTVFHGGEQLNSIPAKAYLQGNVRTIPECDNQATKERLQAIIDDLNRDPKHQLSLSIVVDFMPVVTDPNDPFIGQLQDVVEAVTGQRPTATISHGATDASRYVMDDHQFAVVEYGPGSEDQSHQVDESLDLEDYYQAITVYQKLAHDFLI